MSAVTVSFDGQAMRLDTRQDAEVICQKLKGVEVRSLILQGNTFGIDAAQRIGEELRQQKFLREAHFKDIFTSRGKTEVPIALEHLLNGISQSGTELKLLDLSDNAIGPIGAPSVDKFLRTKAASKIEKLYLNNCGMGPEGGSSISVPVSELRLKEFIWGRNRLENKGARFMFAALSCMKSLEVVKMPQNGMNVPGITSIVQALMYNISTIREIDFSDNTIKTKGAEALEKVILGANNLEVLKLDDCLLKNEGFSVICDAISKSKAPETLKFASFEGNELQGDKIVDLISITFKDCRQGFRLSLLDNEFSRAELERLNTLSSEMEDNFTIDVDDPNDLDYQDEEDDDDEDNSEDESQDDEEGCQDDDGDCQENDDSCLSFARLSVAN